MEDVREVYHRPHDPKRPLVSFDEGSQQQTKETRCPLPTQPGRVAQYEYEYERNGTSNLFIFFAPLETGRHIKVTTRRTLIDFAHCMQDLVDIHFPEAEKIVLVMDNLNTHKFASLYEAFPPDQTTLIEKATAWENRRNASDATVHWRLTTEDARIKLHRLYPVINVC